MPPKSSGQASFEAGTREGDQGTGLGCRGALFGERGIVDTSMNRIAVDRGGL
ncbi:hypothetical protein ACQP0C_17170 [Nocardia sp. CA-129566]|uniref:hypothetical protein n=1 Tax=Nocardia sp. CA-129566 TaxID=3239976 RepID=UPI003D953FFD